MKRGCPISTRLRLTSFTTGVRLSRGRSVAKVRINRCRDVNLSRLAGRDWIRKKGERRVSAAKFNHFEAVVGRDLAGRREPAEIVIAPAPQDTGHDYAAGLESPARVLQRELAERFEWHRAEVGANLRTTDRIGIRMALIATMSIAAWVPIIALLGHYLTK